MTQGNAARAKETLRREARRLRDSMPVEERRAADASIRGRALDLPAYREASAVFSYLSFGSEVDTRGIIAAAWEGGKAVALPRCVGARQLRWFRVESLDALEPGPFGLLEPPVDSATEMFPAACVDAVAIVPGLMFDATGFRLGYGGGYYDAFLAAFAGTSIGVCRRGQLSRDPLPREPHDRPVDIVVTDIP